MNGVYKKCKRPEAVGNFHHGHASRLRRPALFVRAGAQSLRRSAISSYYTSCQTGCRKAQSRNKSLHAACNLFNACVLHAHCALSVDSSHDIRAAQQAAAGGLLRIIETFIKCVTFLCGLKNVQPLSMSLSKTCITIYEGHTTIASPLCERFNKVHHAFMLALKRRISFFESFIQLHHDL